MITFKYGNVQPQPYNYPYSYPGEQRKGKSIAIVLIILGLMLMLFAVILAYMSYINNAPLKEYMGLGINGVLDLIGYVTYKSVFIVIIAWVGSILLARGVQSYVGK